MFKKKRVLSLGLIFLIIVGVLPFFLVDNVKSLHAGYTYTEDFNDHASGEQAYEGWFYTTGVTSTFECNGIGQFNIDGGDGGFHYYYEYDLNINMTSFAFTLVPSIETRFHFHSTAITGDGWFYDVALKEVATGLQVFFYNYSSEAWVGTHGDFNDDDIDQLFTFTFNENNITLNISNAVVSRDYVSTIDDNNFLSPEYDYNDTRIDFIYIEQIGGSSSLLIDELTVQFRTLLGAGLPFDTTGMIQIGDYTLGSSVDYVAESGVASFIEIERDVRMTATVKHVALKVLISAVQLWGLIDDDLKLMLNGEDIGKPDGHIQIDGSSYLFYWANIDKELLDENPLFEFRCTNDGYNWFVPESITDIDLDGDTSYTIHPFASMFQGVYDNVASGDVQVIEKDIVYSFWYDSLAPIYETEYPYWIDCIPDSVDLYESIYCLYTAPIDSNVNLRVYAPSGIVYDAPIENTGFQTGQMVHIPMETGEYNFTLFCTDNDTTVVEKSVNVGTFTGKYLIFTDPNPSKPSGVFDLYYIYNATTVDGYLEITNRDDDVTYFEMYVEHGTSSLTKVSNLVLPYEGVYECRLYLGSNSSKQLKYNYLHLVQSEKPNSLYMGLLNSANQWSYYKEYETFGYDSDIYFVGSHNFVLQNVYVQVTSTKIGVGDSFVFSEEVPDSVMLNAGEYTAYLKLDVNGSVRTLAEYSFSIGESGIVEPDEPTDAEERAVANNIILGLIICGAIGGFLAFKVDPMLFFPGFIIPAFVLSSDSLGSLQMLPSSLGLLLIVAMVISAVVLWLISK